MTTTCYEYCIIPINLVAPSDRIPQGSRRIHPSIAILNEFGIHGWELVQLMRVEPYTYDCLTVNHHAYMKRVLP